MTPVRSRLLAGVLLAAAPLLSGCVAAAIPMLAAGGMLKTQVSERPVPASTGQPRVPIDIARTEDAPAPAPVSHSFTTADGTRMEVMTGAAGEPVPLPASAAPPVAQALVPASPAVGKTYTLADGTRARIIGGALPVPGPGSGASGPATGPEGFTSYDPFYAYAESQATLPVVGSERRSAMLAAPGTLAPETKDCSIYPAAVLIDLDPGAHMLDPATATRAEPGLARTLAALRAQDIAIAWISANTADRAGAVRRALVTSGLDPEGHDELALLRYPEERKQTRREDFAKEFCVVAIAGDERGDFDEMFQYLKDPALAAPLEPLIGRGWFLIPQPLS